MSKYEPPFEITNEILSLVGEISEKIGTITGYNVFDTRPHLRKNNKIKSIHSSLAIEANSLSIGQVRDVINGKLVVGPEKEIQEVKNAYAAYEEIPKIDPYSEQELKRLHGIMTKYIVDRSGEYRTGAEGVFSGEELIFLALPAYLVSEHMNNLFKWMNDNKETLHPLILSSIFHYEFVFIHAFEDGNGRMARLWQTVLLTKWRPIFEFIPLESQIMDFQEQYYEAIDICNNSGTVTPFVLFMLGTINMILDKVKLQLLNSDNRLSEYVRKMLDVMEYDIAYTSSQVMEKLGLKSKETFRKNYMNPALELGLVEMTVPDKPQSRNQRYIKK